MAKPPLDQRTRLIRAGAHGQSDANTLPRTVNPPIQRGSTVLMPTAESLYSTHLSYGRQGLSAQMALSEALTELEGGAGACLYPSGLAAITAVLLALLKSGDDLLVSDSIYAPTRRFCTRVLARFGVTTRYFDPSASADEVLALANTATRLILLESPGSLTFEMQDVPGVARLARAGGILTAIDNTYAAGLTFKPLQHGVDVSIQALTKYVGGHSDVFMGSAAVSDPALLARLKEGVVDVGWAVSPDDAYQMLRGLRTLQTRMEQQAGTALQVASWLQTQPHVREVICPPLPGSRGHELWARDFTGGCGLFAFVANPCGEAAVHGFLDALELFGLGFSWGGYESLAIHCDPQLGSRTIKPDLGGPLIRLHVGLEAPADLIADLGRGFAAMSA
jgi:cysteine-S-conjugate beta-lyase